MEQKSKYQGLTKEQVEEKFIKEMEMVVKTLEPTLISPIDIDIRKYKTQKAEIVVTILEILRKGNHFSKATSLDVAELRKDITLSAQRWQRYLKNLRKDKYVGQCYKGIGKSYYWITPLGIKHLDESK